jgi:signal transduction histidine kinase
MRTWLRVSPVPLAAGALAAGLVGAYAEMRESQHAVPWQPGGYAFVVLAAAALYWRQRAPVAAATAIVVASLAYHLLGYPGLAPAVALYVAIPTLTARGSGLRSCVIAGVLIAALSAVPLLPPQPTSSLWGVIGPSIMLVALAALGEAARVRRVAAEEDARARVVEERLRIAREVHDVLAHTITVITVQAAAAADALDERPEDTRAALAAVRAAARVATTELRGTLTLLRAGAASEPLAPQPGLDQLSALVEQARDGGLAVTVTTHGRLDELTGALQLAVYRIVQESLTNTVRHSRSATAAVTLTAGGGEVVVEVVDSGPALPDAAARGSGGHGLAGMAERIRALGGTVATGPQPPPATGFRVLAHIPARGIG